MRKTYLIANCLLGWIPGFCQNPSVTTDEVTNISATSCIAGGKASIAGGSTPITERGVVYGAAPNPTTSNTKIQIGNGVGSYSITITGLTASTTYHLRAYATNTAGTEYGTDITFTTISAVTAQLLEQTKLMEESKSAIEAFIAKQKESIFKIGMSVAFRTSFNIGSEKKARAIATISPFDKLVRIDYNDRAAVVISTTIAAYPFKNQKDKNGRLIEPKSKFFTNFGFLANINLVEFADNKSSTIFNKQVDGGLGFSYLLGTKQQFALALTYERVSARQPTEFIFEKEGKEIRGDNGDFLTTLDLKDSRFFRDAGFNALSIKFVFHFN